ncbi:MAG: hypothetical protein ABG776_03590, partial [Cyanobacteria bacterium J06555_13]
PKNIFQVFRPACKKLIVVLVFLIACDVLALSTSYSQDSSSWLRFLNVVGPAILFVFPLATAFSILRRYPTAVWTPALLYFISTSIFFGLGPLVYPFGNEATKYFLNRNVVTSVTEAELFRTNLLNAVGTLAVTLTIYGLVGLKYFQRSGRLDLPQRKPRTSLALTAIFFVSVGGALRFFVILPYAFGMTTFVVPGIVNNLGNLIDLGLTIVAYLATQRRGLWAKSLWIIWPIHLLTVILEFKKSALMIALLLPALGAYLANGKGKKLLIWVLAAAAVYYLSQPFVHYGRGIIKADTGYIERATLQKRYNLTKAYFTQEDVFLLQANSGSSQDRSLAQSGWTRLSSAGPQSFAMKEYDAGRPGTTLKNAWIVFIPRVLWPNKPVGIGPGRAFYETVTGHARQANLGLSIYGDGYWQGGWVGLSMLSSLMGAIFLIMSKFSLDWIERREMIFLPIIFISIQMAVLGTTGFFLNKILGPLPIYIAYTAAVNFFLSNFSMPKQ